MIRGSVRHGPRRGDRVELIRVVEHGGLRRPGCTGVVVDGHGVDELGEDAAVEILGAGLDQADPELDVAKEPALVGRPEGGRTPELDCSAGVVQERRGDKQVGSQPRMDLSGVPADRPHGDGVLEQPAGVVVVHVGARRKLP